MALRTRRFSATAYPQRSAAPAAQEPAVMSVSPTDCSNLAMAAVYRSERGTGITWLRRPSHRAGATTLMRKQARHSPVRLNHIPPERVHDDDSGHRPRTASHRDPGDRPGDLLHDHPGRVDRLHRPPEH